MKVSQLAQLVLDASESNIKLYDWQRKWLDDESRFRVMLKSRAVGGSFLIALESFIDSMCNPNNLILLMSYTLDQSLELFRKVKDYIKLFSNIRIRYGDEVYTFATVNDKMTEVEFRNGSRIISLPNSPNRARGYRANHVYLDEAAMFKKDFELKSALMGTTIGKEGRISLISTPKGKRGWFYQAYMSGKNPDEKGEKWSVHEIHYSRAPHITQRDLEAIRSVLSPLEWEQEMELRFLDEINAVFPYEVILACCEDYELELKPCSNPVYMGIDFGRYRDSTVICCLEKLEDELKIVFLHEMVGVDFNQQLETIEKIIKVFNPASIYIDKTGLGIPLYDLMVRKHPQTRGVTFTHSSKEAMVKTLINVIHNKKIKMPLHERLINQLRVFQKIEKTTTTSYSAPEGEHDDYVMALALAVSAALTTQPTKPAIEFGWEW